MKMISAVVVGMLTISAGASAYEKGDRVFGRFQGLDYWYPATISGVEGDQFSLAYDDGSTETVGKSRLRPYVWTKDQKVECEFDSDWKRCAVTELGPNDLKVVLEDGAKRGSPMGKCRTAYPPADPEANKTVVNPAEALAKPKKRVDEDKVDCDKADDISPEEAKAYEDNPLAAITAKANRMCTFAQRTYQKAKAGKGPTGATSISGVTKGGVLATTRAWWEGSDDAEFVKVLGARVTGSGWKPMFMSDEPGVPSSRTAGVAHAISYRGKCFLIFGQLKQNNLNHPSRLKPPQWSGSVYNPSTVEPAQKIDCQKGAAL